MVGVMIVDTRSVVVRSGSSKMEDLLKDDLPEGSDFLTRVSVC
jgi:hypothetical protein